MRPALLAAALALAACQGPDVGQACSLRYQNAAPGPGADGLETGVFECQNPICIASYLPPGSDVKHNPYCSKACVSNRDCYSGETGLVCREVVLDPDFLALLDDATKARYLGEVQTSSFCAAPLQ